MLRFACGASLLLAVLAAQSSVTVRGADLPTADEIRQIYRENRERFSKLHLQLRHRYETTEASCRQAQKRAEEKENVFNLIATSKEEFAAQLRVEGQAVDGKLREHILEQLGGETARREIKRLRSQTKPYHVDTIMEFFANGTDYQLRKPITSSNADEQLASWVFPNTLLTTESLLSDYRDISIYSRSSKTTPAGRWWHQSAGNHAYIMQKHLGEIMNLHLSPLTDFIRTDWGGWHPYDSFFLDSADYFRIVRQEEIDGRLLTIVDMAVPIDKNSPTRLAYRGWLDLKRGALPIRMHHAQNSGMAPADQFDRWEPSDVITTQELREVQPGAFYPVKIVLEHFDRDPDVPQLAEDQQKEYLAGSRKIPMVVTYRHIWDCSLVDIKPEFDAAFFVIPFPKDQKLYDHDSGKMIGALESKPLVKVGQKAPPLSIARWLDGKPRKLKDLRGQVVVLDFWGLWCGACRRSVPHLKEIQERFEGQPVTFISIHTAEEDTEALVAKIREFKQAAGWQYIGAIDQGQFLENSVTSHAYGCRTFPLTVIIDSVGRIAYVDPQDVSMKCDEEDPKVIANFQQKFDAIMKERFECVGETWPLPQELDDNQQAEIHIRVQRDYVCRQIESALNARSQ